MLLSQSGIEIISIWHSDTLQRQLWKDSQLSMGGIKLVVWDSRGRPVGVFAEIACMDPTHIHTSASSRHVNIRMSLKCHPSARWTQSLVSGLWCPGQKVECQVLLPPLLPVWSRALGVLNLSFPTLETTDRNRCQSDCAYKMLWAGQVLCSC